MSDPDHPLPPADVLRYYGSGVELDRLEAAVGRLELERTTELLARHVPPRSDVLDVGGGSGVYAEWLAARGHSVLVVEPVRLHVDAARRRAGEPPAYEVAVGDARALPVAEGSFGVVLLLGPLYHLSQLDHRRQALAEARRACRPGGTLVAAAISRYAGALHTLREGVLADEQVAANVEWELSTGRRVAPEQRRGPLPDAYFHLPGELQLEVEAAGFEGVDVYGVEGPGWLLTDFADRWSDPVMRERILWLARASEQEESMRGVSAHLLAVARRS
jgi:SAM-dependent methyltransferase